MKRILAAVDLSEISPLVVARAVELARDTGGRVKLVRALPLPPPAPPGVFLPPQFDALRGEGQSSLKELLERIPPELRDEAEVAFGDPANVVCDVARDCDADVVLGAHRYGTIARVLGTTAARIVNRIDRPALVVRPIPKAAERSGTAALRAGDVLQRDHAHLEQLYTRLLAAYGEGDWDDVRAQWDAFEPALVAHLDIEEKQVFPLFDNVDAAAVARLRAEHDELRKLLGPLGVRIDLHSLPERDAEELVTRLRAHGTREEELYAWMNRSMTPVALARLSPAA